MSPRDFWEWRPVDFHRKVSGYHIRYEKQAALFREVVAVLVNSNRDTKVHPRSIPAKDIWPLSIDSKPEKPASIISADSARTAMSRHLKILEEKKNKQKKR